MVAALKRVAELPTPDLISEEDVKVKVILPTLRAFGYEDADFNYERRTGRGFVDVVVERFPTGIVVEAKAPRTRLDRYIEQLETYVFHKHRADRATIAILTDGESFNIYGVSGALFRGSLESNLILFFRRSDIAGPDLMAKLDALVGKQNNQKGTIIDEISACRAANGKAQERRGQIERELHGLSSERQRIECRTEELKSERDSLSGTTAPKVEASGFQCASVKAANFQAVPHILRCLEQRGAHSKSRAVDRKWLDEQVIGTVDGIKNKAAVSWGLIELKKRGNIDYEGKPIRRVWLNSEG